VGSEAPAVSVEPEGPQVKAKAAFPSTSVGKAAAMAALVGTVALVVEAQVGAVVPVMAFTHGRQTQTPRRHPWPLTTTRPQGDLALLVKVDLVQAQTARRALRVRTELRRSSRDHFELEKVS